MAPRHRMTQEASDSIDGKIQSKSMLPPLDPAAADHGSLVMAQEKWDKNMYIAAIAFGRTVS